MRVLSSLRARLALLVLVPVIPAAGVILFVTYDERDRERRDAAVQALHIGRAAARSDSFLDDPRPVLPPGWGLIALDTDETLLAQYPEPGTGTGNALLGQELTSSLRSGSDEGSFEAVGPDGVRRLYSFTTLPAIAEGEPAVVAVGIPTEILDAAAGRILRRGFLALIALGALALLNMWVGSNLLVVRGARKLVGAAERLAAGDLRSRTGMDRGRGGEMGKLAGAFDDMATAIENRDSELRSALTEVRLSAQRERRASQLAEVEKARAALFSSVTHDLRTPLTSIKAASTLLLEHEGAVREGERRELLDSIREGADGLDHLITNALQLSRSRAGGLRPRKISAAMDEVASRTLDRMRHSLRDHRVVLVIAEDLPEIQVDVVQLDQVLTNLLENAARFSPPGSEIAVSVMPRDGTLVLRIEDGGPGIPAGERDRVFEPFVKLAGGGGAGLGLPISRAIVEAHGGRVLIEDSPGGGTAVVLELPLHASSVLVPEVSTEGTP